MAKLLLVEDDNNLREIYEARLQAEGYDIVSAKDGEEALVVAKAEKPDLVISDVMMPKISGFEMLDIMRNTDELKNVKVIMLTALGQSDDQDRADKLGADRYLVKSQVTLEDIVKVTHELLEGENAPAAEAPAAGSAAAKPETPAPDTEAPAPADKPDKLAEPIKPAEETPVVPAPGAAASSAPTLETPDKPGTAPEPEVKIEPASEPVPEPAPTPEPETKTDTKPEPDASASNDAAKSTNQEEADVEAKIEDFVAGASSEPTTPSDTASPKSSVASGDDKLMADAVADLAANSSDKTTTDAAPTPATTPTVIPVSIAPADNDGKPADEPDDEPAEPVKPPEEPAKTTGTSGSLDHTKVIEPLEDAEPKKDIKQLLADEEAKETQTVPGTVIAADTPEEDKPSGQPAATPSSAPAGATDASGPGSSPGSSDMDPNSIAL